MCRPANANPPERGASQESISWSDGGTDSGEYERRKAAAHAEFSRQKSRADVFALFVVILGLMTGRQLWLAIGNSLNLRNTGVALAATLMILALWRVIVARERKQARITSLYAAALDRVNEVVTQTGHTGEDFVPEDHLYAWDLDIAGAASLFGRLATTRTAIGQRALAELLLTPTTAEAARQRQDAVQELTPMLDLRERVALLGASKFEEIPAETYETWLAVETPAPPVWYQPLILVVTVLWVVLILVAWLHYGSFAVLLHPLESALLAQGMLCLWLRPQSVQELAAAKHLLGQTAILRRGLAIVASETFHTERLVALQRDCSGQDSSLGQLERWLTVVEHRNKEWFSLLCVAFCGGTHTAFALRRWKRSHGASMRRWLAAWSELDALLALATYAAEHSANVYPEIVSDVLQPVAMPGAIPGAVFEAAAMTHPLLPRGQAVANDLALNPETRFLLISGSNMAGKSTLLRTLGTNVVLALAGAPVPARSMRLSALRIGASLAVRDSLADGRSKFLAEVERLRDVVAMAGESPSRCLFLIDEIFSGTNSADRRIAGESVLRGLLSAGSIGALSTHDLALAELAELPGLRGRNVHMASPDESDPLAFDYLLKPGVNRTTNALAIVKMLGLS